VTRSGESACLGLFAGEITWMYEFIYSERWRLNFGRTGKRIREKIRGMPVVFVPSL
jgi:hypothetical protein